MAAYLKQNWTQLVPVIVALLGGIIGSTWTAGSAAGSQREKLVALENRAQELRIKQDRLEQDIREILGELRAVREMLKAAIEK